MKISLKEGRDFEDLSVQFRVKPALRLGDFLCPGVYGFFLSKSGATVTLAFNEWNRELESIFEIFFGVIFWGFHSN